MTTLRRADAHERGQPENPADGPPTPEDPEPSDLEVIRASATAPECFASLFDRHATAVHRYLARRIGPTADDLLAETFLVAFRQRAAYVPTVGVRPWLIGIATNLLRRHVRQEERRYRALSRSVEPLRQSCPGDEAADRVDAAALRQELSAALAALKRRDRDVLLLSAWAELSYAEIASVLDIPVGTVRSRLNRARRITRAALSAVVPNEEPS